MKPHLKVGMKVGTKTIVAMDDNRRGWFICDCGAIGTAQMTKTAMAYPCQKCSGARAHYITAGGKTLRVREWARVLGCNDRVIHARLHLGWSEQKAVLTPYKPHHRKGVVPPDTSPGAPDRG